MSSARAVTRRLAVLLAVLAVVLAACENGGGDDDADQGAGAGLTSQQGGGADDDADGGADDSGGLDDVPRIVREAEPSVVAVARAGGVGSGVIYSDDGVIVTNAHVVEGAASLEVVFADGQRSPATVLATDEFTDLAVLEVDRADLPSATFADELPEVGALAVAIGAPAGLENTVTAGIVSGVQRSIPAAAAQGEQALVDLVQTDAAISPGNSGGALVNVDGEVMGINVAYLPPATGAVSLGFAIPAPTVTTVVDQLIATGEVAHPYLGINYAAVSPQVAERFGLPADRGVLVTNVLEQGPAGTAGIEPGDVIVGFGGDEVASAGDLLAALRQYEPGDEVTVTVAREGGDEELAVTLEQRPSR